MIGKGSFGRRWQRCVLPTWQSSPCLVKLCSNSMLLFVDIQIIFLSFRLIRCPLVTSSFSSRSYFLFRLVCGEPQTNFILLCKSVKHFSTPSHRLPVLQHHRHEESSRRSPAVQKWKICLFRKYRFLIYFQRLISFPLICLFHLVYPRRVRTPELTHMGKTRRRVKVKEKCSIKQKKEKMKKKKWNSF